MPDGQCYSAFVSETDLNEAQAGAYFPPAAVLLGGLGITELDLARPHVNVDTRFLRFLIGEIARLHPFDAQFYADANPDVEAARLAGDVSSLHDHFVTQGYFERRQPHDLPFDARYYAAEYDDLAAAFAGASDATLQHHFNQHGWHEGRVGVPAQRPHADRWVAATRPLPGGGA